MARERERGRGLGTIQAKKDAGGKEQGKGKGKEKGSKVDDGKDEQEGIRWECLRCGGTATRAWRVGTE
jgi:hypothetical protein